MAHSRQPSRILGHLVAPRLIQGEVLTTAGLQFLLRDPAASTAFAGLFEMTDGLTWELEIKTEELDAQMQTELKGRVDLIGRSGDEPVCAIEAKIHETLEAAQVLHYGRWQERQLSAGSLAGAVLAVLVPEWRRHSAQKLMDSQVEPHLTPRRLKVVTWEEAFDAIRDGKPSEGTTGDLDQLIDLYHQYDATHVEPFTREQATTSWQEREADYKELAKQLTVTVQNAVFAVASLPSPNLLPWTLDRYRYFQLPLPNNVTPGIGLFPGLEGNPFSLRYTPKYTENFDEVTRRLDDSLDNVERVAPDDARSIRLQVPQGTTHYEMLRLLADQVFTVLKVAHPDLRWPADA